MEAEIALVGFGFFRHDVQSGAAMADHRAHHHLHRPVRAGDDAGFAADATLLHHMDKAFIAADGAVRADIGAGGVFTLTAGGRRGNIDPFDHVNTRLKGVRRQGGAVLMFLMGYHAGHFASATADTFARIGDNETVHPFLQQ